MNKKEVYELVKNNPAMMYEPMPEYIRELFTVTTVDFLSECGLNFTRKHTGKMAGMQSVSTTCKVNAGCTAGINAALQLVDPGIDIRTADPARIKAAKKALRRYIKNNPTTDKVSICGFCFSDSQQDYQTSMIPTLSRNYDILNGGILHDDWIPVLNNLYFRGESFGDVGSWIAAANIIRIAAKNPAVHVTAWTKYVPFYRQAIAAGYAKPANLTLVKSVRYVNAMPDPDTDPDRDIVDIWFVVITPEFSAEFHIRITCGARACLACLKCYLRTGGRVIVEQLK